MTDDMGTVYVLKLSRPLGNARHSAWFYVGWAEHLERRLAHHRAGTGAAMTRAAVQRGIAFDVIFSTPGTRADERKIKNYKNTRRWLRRRGIEV